ncbi:MAG: hypothetical protein GY810_21695 [Aureispira sp.]|nr:hypothetical protein [Aureispira sp.]
MNYLKLIASMSASLFLFSLSFAQNTALYYTSTPQKGTAVVDELGETRYIDLNEKITIIQTFIYSIQNDNSEYMLTFYAKDMPTKNGAILKIGKNYYRLNGYGTSMINPTKSKEMFASFTGVFKASHAQEIAKAINLKLQKRDHFGHELNVEFKPDKKFYKLGETINFEMLLTNTSDVAVVYNHGGQSRGSYKGRCNYFSFEASLNGQKLEELGPNLNFGGLEGNPTLKPNQTISLKDELTKWFNFDKPGTYELKCSYELHLELPRDKNTELEHQKYAHERWSDSVQQIITIEVKE